MSPRLPLALLGCVAAASLSMAACSPKKAPSMTVQESMTTTIAPQAQVLWDVTNKALNDEGVPDGSKMSTDDWAQILSAGQQLRDAAQALAKAKNLKAAAEGVRLAQESNPGAAKAADVQRYMDADPAEFARHADILAAAGAQAVSAAQAKDSIKLGDVSDKLDGLCEACHLKFWYPEQAGGPKPN